jgi:very-short-patch-repair endonuclease
MNDAELQQILDNNPDISVNSGTIGTGKTSIPAATDSPLESKFMHLWDMLEGPPLQREYQFKPDRKWRADFAHLPSRTLIEVEGGIWSNGRHVRGHGYTNDCIKYNAAVMAGWRVLRLTSDMLQPDYIEEIITFVEVME